MRRNIDELVGLCALILLFAPMVVFGEETLLRDDFENESIDPDWNILTGETGSVNVGAGYVFLNITDQSKAGSYSHGALQSDKDWIFAGMEVRLRCSDDNKLLSDIGGGNKWWGFREAGVIPAKDVLMFYSYSPESHDDWEGFWAASFYAGKALRERITGVDIREWHTYTILWEPGSGTFLIDGEEVANIDSVTSYGMRAHLYISNIVFLGGEHEAYSTYTEMDVPFNEHIQVDYVRIFGIPETTFLSILGLVLLPALRRSGSGWR